MTSNLTFPRPFAPVNPVLSKYSLGQERTDIPSILDKNTLLLNSGRNAIALALRHANIDHQYEVLLPSYHCVSMVDPVKWTGAKPVFYRINSDMSYNLEHIHNLATKKTKVIIVAHYFGFSQQLDKLIEFCKTNGIILIEDCAHAFFGCYSDHEAIGSMGDYAIASPIKFFPIFDGGCLKYNKGELTSVKLKSSDLRYELKAFTNIIERSLEYKRLGAFGAIISLPFKLKDILWNITKNTFKSKSPAKHNPAPDASYGGTGFDPSWIDVRTTWISKWILKHTDTKRLVDIRIKNYNALLTAFVETGHCIPVHKELAQGVVPYVVPVLIRNSDKIYLELKLAGIPISRWDVLSDELEPGTCTTSERYSRDLLQFSCHQELDDEDLQRIITTSTHIINKYIKND